MSSIERAATSGATGAVFERILCAVDGTRSAVDAAEQALRLVGEDTVLMFLAVSDARGAGQFRQATLSEHHARQAVAVGRMLARGSVATVRTAVTHAADPVSGILAAAEDYDLLVLGGRHQTRLAGILAGRTAASVLHLAHVPVLVARRREGVPFPSEVVVATSGPGDLEAVDVAARVARATGAKLTLVHVGATSDPRVHRSVAEQTVAAQEITGIEPPVCTLDGTAHSAIVGFADTMGAGLLVVGSHGRSGAAAARSVSERVAFAARCSVLVVRPPRRGERLVRRTRASLDESVP